MSVDVNFHLHRIRGDTCMYKKGILMSRDCHENQSSLTSSVPLCLPPGTSQKAWPAQVWSVPTALLKFKILFIQLALVQYSLVTRTQQKIRKEKKRQEENRNMLNFWDRKYSMPLWLSSSSELDWFGAGEGSQLAEGSPNVMKSRAPVTAPLKAGVMVHTYSHGPWEMEAGRNSRPPLALY